MRTFRPRPDLRDRVASIDVVENDGGESTILPGTSAVMGVQYQGGVTADDRVLSPIGVTGIQDFAKRYTYRRNTGSVLVRFTPQGAACLGVPASELANGSAPLDDLLPPANIRAVRAAVLEADGPAERASVLERFLIELPWTPDPLVDRALTLLDAPPGGEAGVATVARTLGVSERQLERRFLRRVGIGPKRYATLRRLERAVALAATSPSLTSVAHAAGYYDQAHFVRDFRRFAGVPPHRFLRPR